MADTNEFRFLVCGGRDYNDYIRLTTILDEFITALYDKRGESVIPVLIHGGAKGADHMAGYWADTREIDCRVWGANWKKYGKSAGFRRNSKMLLEGRPPCVFGFPGGVGTKMMCDLAEAKLGKKKVMRLKDIKEEIISIAPLPDVGL